MARRWLNCGGPAAIALLVVAGCGGPYGGELVKSGKQRVRSPAVPAADLQAQVSSNTAFAVDFYHQLRGDGGNLFFSPYSLSAALAMLHAGARGETERQLAAALRFGLPQSRLHPVFNKLDLELQSRGENSEAADGDAFRLNVVNATWGQQGYRFLTPYLDTLSMNYGAGMRLLDFSTQPEPSRQIINRWVEYHTEDRIKELIPEGKIEPSTVLVLTNAIYFNAAWADPFETGDTRSSPFFLLDDTQISVPSMSGGMDGGYYKGSGFQAASLPYDGHQLSMLVLVPDRGTFEAFESGLTGTQLETIVKNLSSAQVLLSLPRFEFETEVDCEQPLKALGMIDAWGGEANLSGIDGTRELFVQAVLHKAFVKVDEAGTEAAAATAVLVGRTSGPPQTVTLKIDRPFIFLIRDHATGAVLFLGRVVRPG
jgi:serpin B